MYEGTLLGPGRLTYLELIQTIQDLLDRHGEALLRDAVRSARTRGQERAVEARE